MKKIIFLFVMVLVFASCNKEEEPILKTSPFPVQMEEARNLFKTHVEYIYENKLNVEFTLTEITTEEIFQKSGSQLYKVDCQFPYVGRTCFLITRSKRPSMFSYYNNNANMDFDYDNILIADVDKDGNYEFYYTGAGYSDFSENYLAGFNYFRPFDVDEGITSRSGSIGSHFVLHDYKLTVEKDDDHQVFLRYKSGQYDFRIGKVYYQEWQDAISVNWYRENVPAELRRKLGF
jgi:hypothetical protein